jgi:hypothetical protein
MNDLRFNAKIHNFNLPEVSKPVDNEKVEPIDVSKLENAMAQARERKLREKSDVRANH